MRMRVTFVIEEGAAALKQVAACVGFANSLGIVITMIPEDDPKKKNVKWGDVDLDKSDEDASIVQRAVKIMDHVQVLSRKEFAQALGKATKKSGQAVGKIISRWLERGILVETD